MRLHRPVVAGIGAVVLASCGGATSTSPTPRPSTPAATALATSTPTANPSDAYPVVAALQGHLAGRWTNTTFGSTGTITWDVTPNPAMRTVAIVVTLTGRVLGGSAPPPEHDLLTHLAQGVISGRSAAFGSVNGTITPDGRIHMTLTNLPVPSIASVDITGNINGSTTVSLTYTVTFSGGGGTAKGTVTMTKQ